MSQSFEKRRSTINKSNVSYDAGTATPFKRVKSKERRDSLKPKAILQQTKVSVLHEGVDVTPVALNPHTCEGIKERQISTTEGLYKESSSTATHSMGRVESQKFQTNLLLQRQEVDTLTFAHGRSVVTSHYFGDDIVIPPMSVVSRASDYSYLYEEEDSESITVKSLTRPPVADHISLTLAETDTIFLIDIPSNTVLKGSEEADSVEEDNAQYDYLTKGKGRNRKVFSVAVQTIPILKKTRDTETGKVRRKNCATHVAAWVMYDTYKDLERNSSGEESEGAQSLNDDDDFDTPDEHKLNEECSIDSLRNTQEDKQLLKIFKSKAFEDALTVIERILGNNCYNEQQKRFKGLSDPDVFRENIEYKYHLNLLWTYSNEETAGRCVTGLAFNLSNEDIVAVAYGKYFYNDRNSNGMIMVWNIKNPQQPERQYNFSYPVTSIAFAEVNPNLLAVGFYNGHLKILDISRRENVAVREDTTFFEPVWSIIWIKQGEEEDIMASFGDGRVCRYQITSAQHLKRTQIMLTAAAEGKLKGIKYLKKCESKEISITGYDQARCLALHPIDPSTYFVGTSEGVVHRCSTNYYNEHMDLFKAHDGAIHTIKFSPFANKLFYTCGDDFRARLWVDGISEPLITTCSSILPVLDVDWSTGYPTVIASIRGSEIHLWDFQRKMYESQSVHKSPENVFNTVCKFTTNGRCLMVGNMAGVVQVYSLEDMPIAPFYPENLVSQAFRKLLITKPELLKKLRKLGSLNFDKQNFTKYFN